MLFTIACVGQREMVMKLYRYGQRLSLTSPDYLRWAKPDQVAYLPVLPHNSLLKKYKIKTKITFITNHNQIFIMYDTKDNNDSEPDRNKVVPFSSGPTLHKKIMETAI
jgi:hypothetical protein